METSKKAKEDCKHMLLKERVMNNQHLLNYEKLKALTFRLQLESEKIFRVPDKSHPDWPEEDILTLPARTGATTTTAIQSLTEETDRKYSSRNDGEGTMKSPVVVPTEPRPATRMDNPRSILLPQLENSHAADAVSGYRPSRPTTNERTSHMQKESQAALEAAHWKLQLVAFQREFHCYRMCVEAEMRNYKESEEKRRKENERIKGELELQNFQLNATCVELNRNKISLERENTTLREELDETRLKLDEKTAQYESLARKMDSISVSSPKCQIKSHTNFMNQVVASELKTSFLQKEIDVYTRRNNTLIEEIENLKGTHEEEIREMKALLNCIHSQYASEKSTLQTKYKEVTAILDSQQAYVEEIDGFVVARDKENTGVIDEVCKNLRGVVQDGKTALEVIEAKLRATVADNKRLEKELSKTIDFLEKMKEDTEAQERYVNQFFSKLHEIMGNQYKDIVADKEELEPINRYTVYRDTNKLLEKYTFERTINNLHRWRSEYDQKKVQLECRVKELENAVSMEKLKYIELNESYEKKCKLDKQEPIKWMRPEKMSNLLSTQASEQYGSVKGDDFTLASEEPMLEDEQMIETSIVFKLDKLRQSHLHFGNILKTVAPHADCVAEKL